MKSLLEIIGLINDLVHTLDVQVLGVEEGFHAGACYLESLYKLIYECDFKVGHLFGLSRVFSLLLIDDVVYQLYTIARVFSAQEASLTILRAIFSSLDVCKVIGEAGVAQ